MPPQTSEPLTLAQLLGVAGLSAATDRPPPPTAPRRGNPVVVNVDPDKPDGFAMDIGPIRKAAEAASSFFAKRPAADPISRDQALANVRAAASGAVTIGRPFVSHSAPAGQPEAPPAFVRQAAPVPEYQPLPQTAAPPAPRAVVSVDVPGFGAMDFPYHQVILADRTLVLVRWAAAREARFMPSTGGLLSVYPHGADSILVVRPTGHLFTFGNYEFCVLVVEGAQGVGPDADDGPGGFVAAPPGRPAAADPDPGPPPGSRPVASAGAFSPADAAPGKFAPPPAAPGKFAPPSEEELDRLIGEVMSPRPAAR